MPAVVKAQIRKTPATIKVIRRKQEYVYEVADAKDWGVMYDGTVLSIDATDGSHIYWPLDSVTRWTVYEKTLSETKAG